MWEQLVIWTILGLTAFFLGRRLIRFFTSDEGGCSSCTACTRVCSGVESDADENRSNEE